MGKTNNPTGIGGFKPGQSGNPSGVSKNGLGNRPYRAALRIEAAIHEHGGRLPKVRKGSLRDLARQALLRARHNTAALEHVANRLDGPIIPAPDDPPSNQIVEIKIVVVEPNQPRTIENQPIDNISNLTSGGKSLEALPPLQTNQIAQADASLLNCEQSNETQEQPQNTNETRQPTLLCLITHNPCGTNTWTPENPCQCKNCKEYIASFACEILGNESDVVERDLASAAGVKRRSPSRPKRKPQDVVLKRDGRSALKLSD